MSFPICSPLNPEEQYIVARDRRLDLSFPAIMYIVNLTEDSFSDGGRFASDRQAIDSALGAFDRGATIVDLGAESTRPGAKPIAAQQQLDRILPVLKELRKHDDLWISVDTSEAQVIEQVLDQGADVINDVRALQRPGALEATAKGKSAVCLMHMQGTPETMQHNPHYTKVIDSVKDFIKARVEQSIVAGIDQHSIIVDPGFGFGKRLEDNITLLNNLNQFTSMPLLVGLSRKSMLGAICKRQVEQRSCISALASLIAMQQGANIIRVHDLDESLDALAIYKALIDVDTVVTQGKQV